MNKEDLIISINNNLCELNERKSIINEQRSIMISELAKSIVSSMPGESVETVYREFLNVCRAPDVSDKLGFITAVSTLLGEAETALFLPTASGDELPAAGAHGKISYVRNRYNDEAYASFSAVVPHAKPLYCGSFEDSCEALAAGECEFMMLPLEDSTSGKMFGFYSLLDRYEFKIAYACTVEREDASNTIRYALASRYLNLDIFEKHRRNPQKIFEFTMTHTHSSQLLDVYRAASLSLAKEHRTSSISLPYGDNMARFYHSFVINKETRFIPFLLLLALEYPDYSPIGIYREI